MLKKSDYNDVVIRCVGRHVTAWLNGTQVLDNTVPLMADEGIIAFEYSSLAPREVTFRNLELTDLGTEDPAAGFRPLFNGKDLSGWWVYGGGAGNWKVVNNELVGSGPQSHLFTVRGSYEDFQLHAEALINAGGNSGLHFRCNFEPGVPAGYEAQINSIAGDPNRTGTLLVYKGPGRSRVVSHNTSRVPPGEWFSYDVLAQGNHLVLRVNGQVTVDYVDPENTFRKGHIALQQFDPNTVVRFRKIEIKELPPPAAGR